MIPGLPVSLLAVGFGVMCGIVFANAAGTHATTCQLRYAGVLAAGSRWRSRITPAAPEAPVTEGEPDRSGPAGAYRPWAELLARTFAGDVLCCSSCGGRMRLLAVFNEAGRIARYLAAVGEATELPGRSPSRGPPYWKSQVLRRRVLGDEDACGSPGGGADEVA